MADHRFSRRDFDPSVFNVKKFQRGTNSKYHPFCWISVKYTYARYVKSEISASAYPCRFHTAARRLISNFEHFFESGAPIVPPWNFWFLDFESHPRSCDQKPTHSGTVILWVSVFGATLPQQLTFKRTTSASSSSVSSTLELLTISTIPLSSGRPAPLNSPRHCVAPVAGILSTTVELATAFMHSMNITGTHAGLRQMITLSRIRLARRHKSSKLELSSVELAQIGYRADQTMSSMPMFHRGTQTLECHDKSADTHPSRQLQPGKGGNERIAYQSSVKRRPLADGELPNSSIVELLNLLVLALLCRRKLFT